jgi:3-methyladenine DNA glycosylase AlkD
MPDYPLILESLQAIADPQKAPRMKSYMKNQFEYLGVQSVLRRQATLSSLTRHKRGDEIDWAFVETCWADPYRELQYVALDYLGRNQNIMDPSHVPLLKKLILDKSWWDTVDGIVHMVGAIVHNNPELKALMVAWSLDDNMWIRRTAIEHQLSLKNQTDTDLLEVILVNNFGSKEFFINKAIGWALRDYSWTNPVWVRDFIERHRSRLAPLSIREGGKYA